VRGSSPPVAVGREDPASPRSNKRKDTDPVQEAGANTAQKQHLHCDGNDEERQTRLKAEARAYAFSCTSTSTTASGRGGRRCGHRGGHRCGHRRGHRGRGCGRGRGRAIVQPKTSSTGEGRIAISTALTNSRTLQLAAATAAAAVPPQSQVFIQIV